MEYVIQCRFSPTVTNLRPVQELFPGASDAVLFAYAFTSDEEVSAKQAAAVLGDITREVHDYSTEFGQTLHLDPERVVEANGSVILTLLVTTAVVQLPVAPVLGASMAAGIAIWAADKVLGGVLSEYGNQIAHHLTGALFHSASPMRSPQQVADEQAQQMAMQLGGVAISISGGRATKLSDGRTQGFKYSYQVDGPRPGYIIVVTDLHAHRPVEYSFSEIPQYNDPVASNRR